MTEPLYFAAWTLHDLRETGNISTIRVGNGVVEINPGFVDSLTNEQLRAVLGFEAMRVLLGHPYRRRMPNAQWSYQASNLTVQECLRTDLPIPRPRDLLGGPAEDHQYFEYYYQRIAETQQAETQQAETQQSETQQSETQQSKTQQSKTQPNGQEQRQDDQGPPEHRLEKDEKATEGSDQGQEDQHSEQPSEADQQELDLTDQSTNHSQEEPQRHSGDPQPDLEAYTDAEQTGRENTQTWAEDELFGEEIAAAITEAMQSQQWGSIPGNARKQLEATLRPPLDYRGVLRQFRQSVLSVRRRLTRMKPSRRYGFHQMGSRYDFTTQLLFAVDVSGSMSERDLQVGFSIANQFFRYGISSLDVLWFDTQIQGPPMTLRRARHHIEITGRGGTEFAPVLQFIDDHPHYDGLVIFTDGEAAVPPPPVNRHTKVLWLFRSQSTYDRMHGTLRQIGRSAYVKASPRR